VRAQSRGVMELAGIILLVVAWLIFGGIIGGWVGSYRGRKFDGHLFGALLGPVGWIIAALLPEDGKRCVECQGVVPVIARRCRHCGELIVKRPASGERER